MTELSFILKIIIQNIYIQTTIIDQTMLFLSPQSVILVKHKTNFKTI